MRVQRAICFRLSRIDVSSLGKLLQSPREPKVLCFSPVFFFNLAEGGGEGA
jgi:hypothetical protein